MKKVVVIGCGMDVLDKKRGKAITEYFDEIIIIKYSLNFLEAYKEYLGEPTIWIISDTEWYRYNYKERLEEKYKDNWDNWFCEERQIEQQERIYTNLSKSSIKEVWSGTQFISNAVNYKEESKKYFYTFSPVKNKFNENIKLVNKEYKGEYNFTTGAAVITECLNLGYETYYFGFDSFIKGYHFYHKHEDTSIPHKRGTENNKKETLPDMRQYRYLKDLEKQGKLIHVDKILEFK